MCAWVKRQRPQALLLSIRELGARSAIDTASTTAIVIAITVVVVIVAVFVIVVIFSNFYPLPCPDAQASA